jgi:hypothetical protein
LPQDSADRPGEAFLSWHNENCFQE